MDISAFAAYKKPVRKNQDKIKKRKRKNIKLLDKSVKKCNGKLLINGFTEEIVSEPSNNIEEVSDCPVLVHEEESFELTKPQEPSFHTQPLSYFKWIIAPLQPEEFLENTWEKQPVVVKRSQSSYYSHLLSSRDLDQIFRNYPLQYTRNVDVVSYVDGKRNTINEIGRVIPAVLWDYYSNGCSIRLLNPQTYSNKVHSLLSHLQEYFGCMMGANVYLTPPDSQGFAPHYDDIEAFILQLEGRKHWKLYAPLSIKETLPRFSSKNFEKSELGAPIKEVTLEAGDLLYFPRGVIHEGKTDSESHSLHITVSTYQKTSYVDLLERTLSSALKNASEDNIEYRKGLPVDYLKHLGQCSSQNSPKRNKIMKKLGKLFTNLVNYAPFDAAADELGKQFMWDSLPPFLSKNEKSRSVHQDGEKLENGRVINRGEIGLDTKIRLTRYYCIRLVIEDAPKLYYNTENARVYHGEEQQFLELTTDMVPVIEKLLKTYPNYIPVEDIPLQDGVEKMQLASDLWERGILITQQPLEQPDY